MYYNIEGEERTRKEVTGDELFYYEKPKMRCKLWEVKDVSRK